ncbi:MAG: HAD-IA family hydrolase [Gammaproteobacteria bacterium]|nr:HAD-IA family hydrolase [Gammaproteobacteria bacterium]
MSIDRRPEAILFDLDGTLADTAPDLAAALNATLTEYGLEPLPYETIRPVVSHGAIALIQLGFEMQPDEPGFETRRRFLLDVYASNLCRATVLFPGMAEVLEHFGRTGIRWGIVTNKPAWLTDPLMVEMGLDGMAGCVVSGDTCANRKPHPEPILHACKLIACPPDRTWYVGDAGRDMEAGRAAGCATVGARYGYVHPQDPAEAWQADYMIDHPGELLKLLDELAPAVVESK